MLRLAETQSLFWGFVRADGTLTRHSGDLNATMNMGIRRDGLGMYTVHLRHPFSDAVLVATPAVDTRDFVVNAGTRPTFPNEIEVKTLVNSLEDDDPRDADFGFLVIMAPNLTSAVPNTDGMLRLEEGNTLFWGAANRDGGLTRVSRPGAVNVRVHRNNVGDYTITFPAAAEDAIVLITPAPADPLPAAPRPVVACTRKIPGAANQVHVQLREVLNDGAHRLVDTRFKFIAITAPNLSSEEISQSNGRLRLQEDKNLFWGAVNADGFVTIFSGDPDPNRRNLLVRKDGIGRYALVLTEPATDAIVVVTPVHATGLSRTPSTAVAVTQDELPAEIAVTTFAGRSKEDTAFKFVVITAPN